MRHDGIPRGDSPFEGCADGHVPLIDNQIRKLKPFYHGQLTSGQRLANFTSLKQQLEGLQDSAADYYTFLTTNRTKFMSEMSHVEDAMLLRGRGVLKCTVDPYDKYALVDESIDPLFILMPNNADDFPDADEFVHVRRMTVAQYKRLPKQHWTRDKQLIGWDTTSKTIEKIRGQSSFEGFEDIIQQKQTREGITHTKNKNEIIIWEHWVKNSIGHSINYYSPHAPDVKLRQSHGNPYKVGGKQSCPFFSFPMEMKDKGWYAPRGLGELLAPWEMFATKIVNEKADYMTFSNRPIYTGDQDITNSANIRWEPGTYIKGNIRGVQQSAPPMSFDELLNFTRGMAEEAAQSPDFGITEGQDGSKPRTATENQRIGALQEVGTNYNGELFRGVLARVHTHRWGMIVQFKEREFLYYASGQLGQLDQSALHDAYLITPDGSPDGWNRLARFQKAIAAMQTFAGNPNSSNEYWTKEAMAAYDGKAIIKGGFVPTNLKGADEYTEQLILIDTMLAPGADKPNFPAPIKPTEDQASRIKACIDWIQATEVLKLPQHPSEVQRVLKHMDERFGILKKQNPEAAQQLGQMLAQVLNPQPQGQPGNVAPMPQQPQPMGAMQ